MTVQVPFCHKHRLMKIKISWESDSGCDNRLVTVPSEEVARTGGSATMVQATVDLDGCGGIGSCIDVGDDNTFEYECAKGVEVIGLN